MELMIEDFMIYCVRNCLDFLFLVKILALEKCASFDEVGFRVAFLGRIDRDRCTSACEKSF